MRCIDADALIEKLGIAKDCNDCKHNKEPYCRWKPDVVDICEEINDAPTIEPERKKGKWGNHGECPFCSYLRQWEDDRFCGNCGADMRGEQDGKN